uniref:Uncharacterized protein n=1 Tax=Glossina brevipalpis TaxID=37001 RepID=A0A1A9WSD4_9MUSC
MYLTVDENGQFKEDNFNNVMAVCSGDFRCSGTRESNILKIVKIIIAKNFAPKVAELNFNTEDEEKLVNEVFNNALRVLSEEERQLLQQYNIQMAGHAGHRGHVDKGIVVLMADENARPAAFRGIVEGKAA